MRIQRAGGPTITGSALSSFAYCFDAMFSFGVAPASSLMSLTLAKPFSRGCRKYAGAVAFDGSTPGQHPKPNFLAPRAPLGAADPSPARQCWGNDKGSNQAPAGAAETPLFHSPALLSFAPAGACYAEPTFPRADALGYVLSRLRRLQSG